MNQKNNKLNFEKTSNENNNHTPQNQREKIKAKIKKKYNLSSEEADKVLAEIEKNKYQNNAPERNSNNLQNSNQIQNEKNVNNNSQHLTENYDNHNINTESEIPKIDSESQYESKNQTDLKYDNNLKEKNVDSLIGDIIPDYNQQISIELKHVDLTFEVQNEKIDTLKEAFVRTLRREKTNKIKIHALNDMSLQIYKGEKVGIIGYNGAGKSTLLNVITGIYPPDKGKVCTYGKISPLLALGAGFDPNYSGRQNIMLNGAVLGYEKKYLKSKMNEIIEFSELGEFIDIPIKNYSSGMLAKLGFSIATSVNPDILIIDEILGVGDVNFMKKSADKLKSLMDGRTTVLLVSHSIPQIRELCDKAIWIDNGLIREIGEVNKVCDNYLKDAEKASNEQLANIELVK